MKEWIALNMTPGVGPRAATKLLERFGSADAVFQARRTELESLRLKPETIESILKREFEEKAIQELEKVKALGGDVLILDDGSYPAMLREIADPPITLYVKGRMASVSRSAMRRGHRFADVFDLWRECLGNACARSCLTRHLYRFGPGTRHRRCGS
jgi:predicted Rossmann fold nucleotide-binding protein DprA/Smf involved in DNA uptake